MEVVFTSCATISELQQIQSLQQKNLIANQFWQKGTRGFCNGIPYLGTVVRNESVCSHTIAMNHPKVVGYALSSPFWK